MAWLGATTGYQEMAVFTRRSWQAQLALGLALACGAAPEAAVAQLFFRPFAYTYRYEIPPDDFDEAPRFASRRAVGRILAREGYQLVGPLGQRGEQVIATGVSRREGEMRFFIDPYEGQIIRAIRTAPPPSRDRSPINEGRVIEPLGGSRPVVRDFGGEPAASRAPHRDRGRRASEIAHETPRRESSAPERKRPGSSEVAAPSAVRPNPVAPTHAAPSHIRPGHSRPSPVSPSPARPAPYPPSPALTPGSNPTPVRPGPQPPLTVAPPPAPTATAPTKPQAAEPSKAVAPAPAVEAPKPAAPPPASADAVKPAAPSPGPAEAATPTPRTANPPKAVAPPHAAEAAKLAAPAPRPTPARSTGGSSRRAIVPPNAAGGPTAVTPTAPKTSAPPTVKTPETAKTPEATKTKSGG